jgi:hypothetical protein
MKDIPETKVKGISALFNRDQFIEMTLPEQRSLISKIQAALQAKEIGKDDVYDNAKRWQADKTVLLYLQQLFQY